MHSSGFGVGARFRYGFGVSFVGSGTVQAVLDDCSIGGNFGKSSIFPVIQG